MKTKILILFIFSVLLFAETQALVFYPVKYKFWTNKVSATVGTPVDMPIYVQNLGLLADNYTVSVVYPGEDLNPGTIKIENPVSQTEEATIYQTVKTTAKLTLSSATTDSITIRIYVMSNTDAAYNPASTCVSSSECSYLGDNYYCLSGKCAKYIETIVRAGMASLPDFTWLGLLQIILLASILVFLKF